MISDLWTSSSELRDHHIQSLWFLRVVVQLPQAVWTIYSVKENITCLPTLYFIETLALSAVTARHIMEKKLYSPDKTLVATRKMEISCLYHLNVRFWSGAHQKCITVMLEMSIYILAGYLKKSYITITAHVVTRLHYVYCVAISRCQTW